MSSSYAVPRPSDNTDTILATPEQEKIIRYHGDQLVVIAFAGAGKTWVLTQYAHANPDYRILYLAYNRAIRDEAIQKFPFNVECKTSHQLAYASVGKRFAKKLTNNLRLTDVAQALNSRNWTLARDVLKTLNNFLCSADGTIAEYHFFDGGDAGENTRNTNYIAQVVEKTERIWARMIDIDDEFPIVHDGYLKLYQMGTPTLSQKYGIILFDEAQDANPVTSDIVLKQSCKVVLVGDPHQQIYRFRGANNALKSHLLKKADTLYLTQSFRFGDNVSLVANCLLELKGEQKKVVGFGENSDQVTGVPLNDVPHKACIHRTVMGVLENALAATSRGDRVFWVGGMNAYQINDLLDLYYFSMGVTEHVKNKQLLKNYQDFDEYEQIATATKDGEMLRAIKIINTYDNMPERVALLRQYTAKEEHSAQITVSTAHRCKGLEWDHVQLADDFADVLDPELSDADKEDEINLLYVAATRAMKQLVINASIGAVIRHITKKRAMEAKDTIELT